MVNTQPALTYLPKKSNRYTTLLMNIELNAVHKSMESRDP